GLSSAFWAGLAACLPGREHIFVDLGFTGGGPDSEDSEKAFLARPVRGLYITQSLGTLWALKHCAGEMSALAAINGFACFEPFASRAALRAMKRHLVRDPAAQMADFYRQAGVTAPGAASLCQERLLEGLDWLEQEDERETLRRLPCPVLSLAGAQDRILPEELMRREWAGFPLHMHEEGGHALPQTHPGWCAAHIEALIKALEAAS
ncbi:MAG: alpha/beta hydrolase, partial [Alphaproteobacteria bacterium]